jgi:RNA recognition motif-containing protein
VKNIPYDCNEQTVRDVMTPYGVVKDVRLAVANTSSGSTPRLKGFGYVQFASEVSVNKACAAASAGTLKIGKNDTTLSTSFNTKMKFSHNQLSFFFSLSLSFSVV